jgi:hypothetical protein
MTSTLQPTERLAKDPFFALAAVGVRNPEDGTTLEL